MSDRKDLQTQGSDAAAGSATGLVSAAGEQAGRVTPMNRVVLAVLGTAAVLLIALAAVWPIPAFDLWWQLKAGELILQLHSVPNADVFSHTAAGELWVLHEWLTEIVLYLLYTRVSPEALVFYKTVAVALTFALVLWRCWARTGEPLVAVGLTVLAAYAARSFFDMRPQVLTYLCLALLLLLVDQWRLGRWPRALWAIPPLMLLWVNCHSGFVIGLVVLAVETGAAAAEAFWSAGSRQSAEGDGATEATGRRGEQTRSLAPSPRSPRRPVALCLLPARSGWRPLAAVLAASVVVGVLNPYGVEEYLYPITLLSHAPAMDQVLEWLSPDFHQAYLWPFEILLIAAMLGWGLSSRPRRTADILICLGLIKMSLYSTRHVPIFAIACAPVVAEHLVSGLAAHSAQRTAHSGRDRLRGYALCAVRCALCALALAALLFQVRQEWRRIPSGSWFAYCADLPSFPSEAVTFLQAHPGSGNLLNEYNWGGYCLYRLYPSQKVFIDGRSEVYFKKAFDDYSRLVNLQPGWGDLLDEWHIDTVLMPPSAPLAGALPQIGWSVAYQDAKAVVLRRGSVER